MGQRGGCQSGIRGGTFSSAYHRDAKPAEVHKWADGLGEVRDRIGPRFARS